MLYFFLFGKICDAKSQNETWFEDEFKYAEFNGDIHFICVKLKKF